MAGFPFGTGFPVDACGLDGAGFFSSLASFVSFAFFKTVLGFGKTTSWKKNEPLQPERRSEERWQVASSPCCLPRVLLNTLVITRHMGSTGSESSSQLGFAVALLLQIRHGGGQLLAHPEPTVIDIETLGWARARGCRTVYIYTMR